MSEVAAPLKVVTPILCVLLLFSGLIMPLHAQLSPARDLTGTWQSSSTGMYYEMDPSDPTTRMTDLTATFTMDITQQGSQIAITLYFNVISYTTDPAYMQEYGIPAVPPVENSIGLTGTVSSSTFTAGSQSILTQEQLVGSFTTDLITATLTGNVQETNPNGIVVTRTGSPPPPTSTPQNTTTPTPTTTTSPPTSTPTQPTPYDLGSVALVKGPAYMTTPDGQEPINTQTQIGTGTEIQTDSNSVVGVSYPDQGGTVYLGGNTDAGWVALKSQPAPDGTVKFMADPSTPIQFKNWKEGLTDMGISVLLAIAIDVFVFKGALPLAAVHAVVVEGVVFLSQGTTYMKEAYRQGTLRPVEVPQGLVVGDGTEYVVTVSGATTTVQVIDGSVLFIDQFTNNTVTVGANQMLTLPPKDKPDSANNSCSLTYLPLIHLR